MHLHNIINTIMLCKNIIILVLCVVVSGEYMNSDEEYVDSVINMLLNGGSMEVQHLSEEDDDKGEEPILHGGVWKCGNCTDIDEAKLMYTESNEVDADMMTDNTLDIQIGLILPEMRCVTVSADVAGVVRRVAGNCSGGTVTLSVSPAQHFTVQVYN